MSDSEGHAGSRSPVTPTNVVLLIVGAALLLSVGLIGYLAAHSVAIPDVLQNVAVGSLTGLVGLLVKPPSG